MSEPKTDSPWTWKAAQGDLRRYIVGAAASVITGVFLYIGSLVVARGIGGAAEAMASTTAIGIAVAMFGLAAVACYKWRVWKKAFKVLAPLSPDSQWRLRYEKIDVSEGQTGGQLVYQLKPRFWREEPPHCICPQCFLKSIKYPNFITLKEHNSNPDQRHCPTCGVHYNFGKASQKPRGM
jgi:hypothetical protein